MFLLLIKLKANLVQKIKKFAELWFLKISFLSLEVKEETRACNLDDDKKKLILDLRLVSTYCDISV